MIRGTTKHNRLEANSSPIAEPSVKAVSLKRNKMKHTKGKWKKMDYWFPCYVFEPVHLEDTGLAYSIQKLPNYRIRGWKFGLVDAGNPSQIEDKNVLGFAKTLKIAKSRVIRLIAKAEGK